MNEKINGICIDGKFYEATEDHTDEACDKCDLRELCDDYDITDVCTRLYGFSVNFKYSKTLTDKLNGNEKN